MAVNLRSTKTYATSGVKVLVYGMAGAGKTRLIATAPNPVVISAESGLLSLTGYDIPYIDVKTMQDLGDAYKWATGSEEAEKFGTICLDSVSEIAEVILTNEKAANKDPRKAYGTMADSVTALVRSFRDIPGKHVYVTAKAEQKQDESGLMLYQPSIPGAKVGQALPYFFDEVFALRTLKDADGLHRWLQTQGDQQWTAKDRSGCLDPEGEKADLGAVIAKITGKGAADGKQ
jgi:hypothetical protein